MPPIIVSQPAIDRLAAIALRHLDGTPEFGDVVDYLLDEHDAASQDLPPGVGAGHLDDGRRTRNSAGLAGSRGAPPSALAKHGPFGGQCVYNGIDRVDNTLGYVAGNIVTCCKTCNHAKMDMPYDDFMAWIARLTERMWFHPELMPSRLLQERDSVSLASSANL